MNISRRFLQAGHHQNGRRHTKLLEALRDIARYFELLTYIKLPNLYVQN